MFRIFVRYMTSDGFARQTKRALSKEGYYGNIRMGIYDSLIQSFVLCYVAYVSIWGGRGGSPPKKKINVSGRVRQATGQVRKL